MAGESQDQMNVRYFQSAGITVEVRSDFSISGNTFHPKFKQFEVAGPGKDNVLINHHFYHPAQAAIPDSNRVEIHNRGQWKIYRTDDSWIYHYFPTPDLDPGYPSIGVFNREYTSFSVYAGTLDRHAYQNAQIPALTLFNNDQVMFANLLYNRNGLILHANGFDIYGNGILLTGTSGVGKSTLSGFLKKRGFKILCDDRMFVTRTEDGFQIHGNWCHGTVSDTSPGTLPLKAVMFLEQSAENSIAKILDTKQIVYQLIRSMVKPVAIPEGWHKTFNVIESMARNIRCFRVKFDLSGKIADMIKGIQF